jgi:hypothetical protein
MGKSSTTTTTVYVGLDVHKAVIAQQRALCSARRRS